ncbi:putative ankyrin repeat protein RF_0381 [Diorhabda carinulata]|uniref:putative ankyrin repeat protein RF_0381 n=1 Tax=Diorhabda carinulata TaxID=1163345 RepID=UPI0025A2501B|nr:putative ankyrin repeat protein RF_0381 [Diorhabda carinulata]
MAMDTSNELLIQAVYKHDLTLINCYLLKGASINKICSNGMTPLGVAAQTGNLPLLKALLEHHTPSNNLDIRNENFSKPHYLHLDSNDQKRYKNIGYFVVCKDVEENEFGDGPTPDGMEALEWDMEVNETDFSPDDNGIEDSLNMYKWYANILTRTSILLDSPERDISRLDRHGQSVLHYAVNTGNIDMVEYLMTTAGKDISVNQCDACCFSPLHMAAANGDIEMTKWLLNKGANVNAVGGRHRQNALHVATRGPYLALMRILVEAGADVNAVDVEEHSILTCAVRQGCEETVRFLVRKGARVNHEESGGVTALRLGIWANNSAVVKILLENGARVIHSHHLVHVAVSNNNLDIIKMLVESGAMVNSRDDQGQTPLMLACSRKNFAIAKYLLSHGADVNAANHIDGKTALHVCVQDVRETKSIYQLVDLLVKYGADMNASSYQGNVLFYSIILENRSAAIALVQHGADVNIRDERAYVDNLSLAKRHGDLELVKLLVYGGFKLSDMTWDPRALRTKSPDSACDFLVNIKMNPLNLREICRIAIRKQIGSKGLMSRILALPLPTVLQRYLALEIL